MRLKILSVALILLTLVSAPAAVSAQTIQAAGQIIIVTAKVESNIFVVVDGAGRITQIFSNSDARVEPTFVSGNLNGPIMTVSAATQISYDALMNARTISYGMLYEREQPLAPQLSILIGQPAATINVWPKH